MADQVLAKLAIQIAANTAQFNTGLKSAQSQFSTFTSGVTKAAGAIGVAFGIQQIASFTAEISKLAGEVEGVKAAFDRLPDSIELMNRLRAATGGTVSELGLMKRAVQAANFGISLQALPKLLEFATLRAQQTGQSVDYLVDSIVTGIGRKSKLILDNLGISAVQLNEALGGVTTGVASIGDVADAVGRIADENLNNMAGFAENAATKFQRLEAAWENFKASLGSTPTGVFSTIIKATTDVLNNFGTTADRVGVTIRDLASRIALDFDTESTIASLRNLRSELGAPFDFSMERLRDEFKLTDEQAAKLKNILDQLNTEFTEQERIVQQFKDFVARNGYEDLSKAADDYKNRIYELIVAEQIQRDQLRKTAAEDDILVKRQTDIINGYFRVIDAINAYTKTLEKVETIPQIESLQSLQDQVAELRTEFNTAPTGDILGLQKLDKRIEALLLKIELVKNAVAGVRPEIDSSALTSTAVPVTGGNVGSSLAQFSVPAVDGSEYIKSLDNLENKTNDFIDNTQDQMLDFSGLIAGGISDLANSLGEAARGVGNFGDSIIEALIGFARQMGEILIGAGVAALAAKKLIKNPYGAIIAGAALVAIAGFASASLSKSQSAFNSGSSSSGGGSSSPQFSPTVLGGKDPERINFTFRIEGTDLVAVIDKTNKENGRLIGTGG